MLIASCLLFISVILYLYGYTYIHIGGDKMKVKYTYQTDAERLQILKVIAVHYNCPVNKLLDEIIDEFIKQTGKKA